MNQSDSDTPSQTSPSIDPHIFQFSTGELIIGVPGEGPNTGMLYIINPMNIFILFEDDDNMIPEGFQIQPFLLNIKETDTVMFNPAHVVSVSKPSEDVLEGFFSVINKEGNISSHHDENSNTIVMH